MGIVSIKQKGDFGKTEQFLDKLVKRKYLKKLERYGEKGVEALANATPKDTGKTAASWSYEIIEYKHGISITWVNSNTPNGVNVAVMLQYGHADRSGHWVNGIDYINPALKPIFDEISEMAWKEVVKG